MARRRPFPLLLLAAALACGAAACDWTVFDELERETPVRALARPTDMDSVDYPAMVLPVTAPRGAAELLVIGANNTALAHFTFETNGHSGAETVASKRFVVGAASVGALQVAAYLPGADGAPRVAAVSDDERQPLLINLDGPETAFTVTPLGAPLPAEANALAVGDATGAGTADIVIAGPSLTVIPDGGAGARVSCDIDPSGAAVAVGRGFVVVSQSDAPGSAQVVLPPFENDLTSKCVNRFEIAAPVGATRFGTALAVADLDGDGVLEIVISAPDVPAVYVYDFDPTVSAPPAVRATLPAPAEAAPGAYGAAVAAGVVEGRRTVLVGDPAAAAGAGVVWVYPALDAAPARLDRPNEDVLEFGGRVGVVPFVGTAATVDLVWVSGAALQAAEPGVVYLHFWVTDPASDPRVL